MVSNPCDPGYGSWSQQTRVSGLPAGENRVTLRSLVLTHYQRDGRTGMPPVDERSKHCFVHTYIAAGCHGVVTTVEIKFLCMETS